MQNYILSSQERRLQPVPLAEWQQELNGVPASGQARLRFMSDTHHRVRYFVVREMVRRQCALSVEWISTALDLPRSDTERILDDLEQHLFFLVRNAQGDVTWAFPFTVEPTEHTLVFNTGERLYGA